MTEFRGTMIVNFSTNAKNPEEARLQIKNIVRRMTAEDVLRNITIHDIDPESPNFNKKYFEDLEDDDE